MEKWKSAAQRHGATALIISVLIGMTAYLSTGKLDDFSRADAACAQRIEKTCEELKAVEKRVDKLEIILPYTTDAIDNNTEAIKNLTSGVQEIKTLMLSNIKRKDNER